MYVFLCFIDRKVFKIYLGFNGDIGCFLFFLSVISLLSIILSIIYLIIILWYRCLFYKKREREREREIERLREIKRERDVILLGIYVSLIF